MAKLPRVHQKIFAENAVAKEIGQFGSAVAGAKKETGDIAEIQALEAWEKGWSEATVSKNRYPALQERNGIDKVITQQLAYMFQEGIPEWNAETEYSSTGLVKSLDGNKIKLYRSLKDGNVGHLVSEPNWWEEVNLGGSGLEVCDIGMSLFVDETKGLRRYLNGQIVEINSNTQAFLNRLLQIQTTNPEYFTTEDNWQAEALLNIDGCVYKFVLNYASDGETVVSVRLPKYPDYVEINAGGTLPVVGNGISLGFTNGIQTGVMSQYADSGAQSYGAFLYTGGSGSNVGTAPSGGSFVVNRAVGLTTDPTKSGIEATLNQTKLKLRYYIQIATGQETEVNITNEIELNNPYTLFDSKYSPDPLYNLSWLKSDREYKPKATYVKPYEALVVEHNPEITAGTSVQLPSGTTYVKRGLSVKLSTEEYTDYDFVINTSDETFRLPIKAINSNYKYSHFPDFNNQTSLTTNFIAPNNGWFCLKAGTQGAVTSINGVIVQNSFPAGANYSDRNIFIRVKKEIQLLQ